MQTGNTSLQGKVNRHAPMVSVGLPAFKRAYLAEALECWRRQTYGDFELLVSDDASPEDLREVAAPFLDDPRFAYVRRERNSSPYFARNWNDCLAWARGKYFVLASDDDLYDARFLEEMVALAEAHPECDIFMCGWSMLGRGADGAWQRMPMPARRNWESGVTFLFHRYAYNMRNVAPPVLVRTQALRDLGGFADLPAAWFVDDLTWAKLANKGGESYSGLSAGLSHGRAEHHDEPRRRLGASQARGDGGLHPRNPAARPCAPSENRPGRVAESVALRTLGRLALEPLYGAGLGLAPPPCNRLLSSVTPRGTGLSQVCTLFIGAGLLAPHETVAQRIAV